VCAYLQVMQRLESDSANSVRALKEQHAAEVAAMKEDHAAVLGQVRESSRVAMSFCSTGVMSPKLHAT
jgi:hypothetical protein